MFAHYYLFALFLYCHSLFWVAFILAAWLGGFTLVYTPGVVQNSYKVKQNKKIVILTIITQVVSSVCDKVLSERIGASTSLHI